MCRYKKQFHPKRTGSDLRSKWMNMNKSPSNKSPVRSIATHPKLPKSSTKRRKRVMFTDAEVKYILHGMKRYRNAEEKWYCILNDPSYKFHPSRTSKDLLDKYRNLEYAEEKNNSPRKLKRRKAKQYWSPKEEEALFRGYQRYKKSKTPWSDILQDKDFKDLFHPSRDNVSLKDKYRNMKKRASKQESDESSEEEEE